MNLGPIRKELPLKNAKEKKKRHPNHHQKQKQKKNRKRLLFQLVKGPRHKQSGNLKKLNEEGYAKYLQINFASLNDPNNRRNAISRRWQASLTGKKLKNSTNN